MQTPSKEQLRIKSLLYPWILFQLMNGQDGLLPSTMLRKTPLPSGGCYSTCKDAGFAVVWDRPSHRVDLVKKDGILESTFAGKVGFELRHAAAAVKFFEDGKLQVGSMRRLFRISDWVKLLKGMLGIQSELGVENWEHVSDEQLLRKVLITFYAAVEGLNGLAELDAFSNQLMHHLPNGVIHLHINDVGENLTHIVVNDGRLRWSADEPPVDDGKSVDFTFKNLELAWKSVANLADNLAAVGKGDIRLKGYIPLADGFNHMLDRLQIFVKTS